jgi:hypothetical protein
VRLAAVAVLEHLNADNHRIARVGWKSGEVATDEAITAGIARPAVLPRQEKYPGRSGPGHDVVDEGHRRFVTIAAKRVFGVPGGCRAAVATHVPSTFAVQLAPDGPVAPACSGHGRTVRPGQCWRRTWLELDLALPSVPGLPALGQLGTPAARVTVTAPATSIRVRRPEAAEGARKVMVATNKPTPIETLTSSTQRHPRPGLVLGQKLRLGADPPGQARTASVRFNPRHAFSGLVSRTSI